MPFNGLIGLGPKAMAKCSKHLQHMDYSCPPARANQFQNCRNSVKRGGEAFFLVAEEDNEHVHTCQNFTLQIGKEVLEFVHSSLTSIERNTKNEWGAPFWG